MHQLIPSLNLVIGLPRASTAFSVFTSMMPCLRDASSWETSSACSFVISVRTMWCVRIICNACRNITHMSCRFIVQLTKLSVDLDGFKLELDLARQRPDRVGVAIPSSWMVWILSIHAVSSTMTSPHGLTTTNNKRYATQRTKVFLSLRGCDSARTPGPSSA